MTESATSLERVVAAAAIAFSLLPPLGQPLEGGTFCGIVTAADGTHQAVVLLSDKPEGRQSWKAATDWAESVGGQLPTRPVTAMLFANAKTHFEDAWYWTNETHVDDASSAWYCYFGDGGQYGYPKSYEGRARAVRLIRVRA